MTENEVTNTEATSAAIEPEKKVPKEEETEVPQTSASKDTEDDPIEEGPLEKHSSGIAGIHILDSWNARYFVFGTDKSKCSQENLRPYYKKTLKSIRALPDTAGATPLEKVPTEDGATTSAVAATEAAGETAKNDDRDKAAFRILCTNVAHATQTGKGLLFYYKSKDHTKEPHGIINLKFVKEVKEGGKGYDFKIITENREYVLKADSESYRKRWINTINTKIQEAKEYPLPENDEYKGVYEQASQKRFLKDGGVTSDSENYTSGEDSELKPRRKYFSLMPGKRPEKSDKTEKTEKAEKTEKTETTTTTTTTEITETVQEGSTVVATAVNTTTSETTEEKSQEKSPEKIPERRPSLNLFSFFRGSKSEVKDSTKEKSEVKDSIEEKSEVKDSTEEIVEAETSTAAETKVEVLKTETEIEKTETETSPTTKFSLKKFFGRSPAESKVVEAAEQTVVTTEETAEGTKITEETKVTNETKITEEPIEKITEGAVTAVEEVEKVEKVEVEEMKFESSNTKKTSGGIFRRVTQVFRKKTADREFGDEIVEEVDLNRDVVEAAAGSSTEDKKDEIVEAKKEEVVEEAVEEIIEAKKDEVVEKKPSIFKRLSKQTQPSQPEEVEPATQPTTTIESAADATDDKESENLVIKTFDNPPRKYGHLNMLTKRVVNVMNKPKPRYFVFTQEGKLYYYKSDKEESTKKEIVINHGVKITEVEDNKLSFKIDSKLLIASSEEERNEWITILDDYKKSLPETEQSSSSKAQEKVEEVVRDVKDEVETTQAEVTETKEIATEKVEEVTTVKTEEIVEEIVVIAEDKTAKIVEETKEITEEKTVEITDDKPEIVEEKITAETSAIAES